MPWANRINKIISIFVCLVSLFANIIMYSEHNRNSEDIIRTLENNIEKSLTFLCPFHAKSQVN